MNLHELQVVAAEARAKANAQKHCIRVCMAASCQSSGSGAVLERLRSVAASDGECDVCVKGVGCMGLCSAGPLVSVSTTAADAPLLYAHVQGKDATELFASVDDKPAERLTRVGDMPFFTRQKKVVLENSGVIDPEQIDDYIAVGGYDPLVRAVTELSPYDVLREVAESGLRGRGGGGYPAGLKWTTVARASDAVKYVICNADEGDPGAFM
ncbi:MAG: NAD(P)H-dependent oxidoreductase subunit E, partial [Planctomycetales bacterium]|nr:NAD(P)H-dependent oxidoreductase subunit E [Planctomycetales bacterium]